MMKYVPSLDGVRGLAVVMVMLHHFGYGYYGGGSAGVDLFFALSGYLISRLLLAEHAATGNLDIRAFYIRRALRLLPALGCMFLLTWAYYKGPTAMYLWDAIPGVFYFANFLPLGTLGLLSHTWSLSIEEQFYLAYPLLLKGWLLRQSRRFQLQALAALIVGALAARLAVAFWQLPVYNHTFTLTRCDALLLGALLAFAEATSQYTRLLALFRGNLLGWTTFAAFFFAGFFSRSGHPCAYWIYSGISVVLLLTSQGPPSHSFVRFLASPPMAWLGKRSYGLYLYHVLINELLEPLRTRHSLGNLAAVTLARFALSFLLAEVSYRLVERRFLLWKDQFHPDSKAGRTVSRSGARPGIARAP